MTAPRPIAAAALALLTALVFAAPNALARSPHGARGILPGEPRVQIHVHGPRHHPPHRRRGHGGRVLRGAGIFFGAAVLAAALAAEAEAQAVEEVYIAPQPAYSEPVYQPQPVYRPAPSRRGPPPNWIPEGANQARRQGPPTARPAQPESFDPSYDTEGYDDEGDDYEPPSSSAPAPPGHGTDAPARVYRPSSRQSAPQGGAAQPRVDDPWTGPSEGDGGEGYDEDYDDEESGGDDGAFDDLDPWSGSAPTKRPLAALVPAEPTAPALPALNGATPTAEASAAPAMTTAKSKDLLGAKARAALAAEILALVNAERDAQGAAPLQPNATLAIAATAHSEEMARLQYFGHQSPVSAHPRFTHRIKEAGVTRYGIASENLAKSAARPSAAKDLLDLWLKSPGHRDALLNPAYQLSGVGVWSDGTYVYATQLFADYIEQR
ncbi:MAG: CAP domain-containing protein [Myxococcota bacterium]